MATKTFKIGLSNTDKQNMAQDVYERLLALTFPEYDTTESYEVGDFVVYNDQLYKCIGSTSGTWDATKWQLATLNDLLTDIEDAVAFVNDKANVDGNYPTMTVGNADQLNSTVYVLDKVPYLYRTSGGDADIGNREYDKIIGGSLVVNQLVFDNVAKDYNNYTPTPYGSEGKGFNSIVGNAYNDLVVGHKVLVSARISNLPSNLDHCAFVVSGESMNLDSAKTSDTKIYAVTSNPNKFVRVYTTDTNVFSITIDKYEIIDLTQMFGSTIADYIYALEQANAGAGVAWFRNYFQELYYPYNAGAIKNVKLVSHDMVGFNQWDEHEQWESGGIDNTTGQNVNNSNQVRSTNYIKCLPNTTYFGKVLSSISYIYIFEYDIDKNFIRRSDAVANTTFTTSSNCKFIRFRTSNVGGTIPDNSICINLSWSGWRNGQYEPYQKNSYPLDNTIELRGIPKLDADNHLYFDGDEYSSDGKVVRKYGSYTFTGNETWADIGADRYAFSGLSSLVKIPSSSSDVANIRVVSLMPSSSANVNNVENGVAITSSGQVSIHSSSITSVAQAQTFMTGKTIVYELATIPEPESAMPFQEPQIVDDFGTEEYVVPTQDGWQVPVGHDTKYPANLRDKLQRLPDMPSVSQNVTETYVVNYNGTTKKCTFVDIAGWLGTNGWIKLTDISGYDATKTQTLKNVEGTLTWVDDE